MAGGHRPSLQDKHLSYPCPQLAMRHTSYLHSGTLTAGLCGSCMHCCKGSRGIASACWHVGERCLGGDLLRGSKGVGPGEKIVREEKCIFDMQVSEKNGTGNARDKM